MACTLSNLGIQTGCVIQASQVSQSIDAFTKAEEYDVSLSGSLTITGSLLFSGSEASSVQFQQLPNLTQNHLLNYNCNTGGVGFVCVDSFVVTPSEGPYFTSSNSGYAFEIQPHDTLNKATGSYSVISGGNKNEISNQSCTSIVGGFCNTITSSRSSANNFIGGGSHNNMNNTYLCRNSILGGCLNEICGPVDAPSTIGANTSQNVIGGGCKNIISGSSVNSIIGSGTNNLICGCINSPGLAFIGGGNCNVIQGCAHYGNSIVGGCKNTIDPSFNISPSCQTDVRHSAILGGINNTASACESYIIGGCENFAKHECSFIVGSNITSSAVCTTYVNNLNVGCTVHMLLRKTIGTGQAGMLVACETPGGLAELYFHDGNGYKKVCLI
tara:strand:- start:1150 stop:2304 length:1155 start_codon:yes stop_codon:yes gene_type:complete